MLALSRVSKRYRRVEAVAGVSFTLKPGSVTALLGANGAGKTTLIKCIMGLIRFRGRITVEGADVAREGKRVRSWIGYLPQEHAFHPDLTVSETAKFYADMRGLPAVAAREVIERAGLGGQEETKAGNLSGGMAQRLSLALSLLGDPKLLILDEPAAGLDVQARAHLRTLIEDQRDRGRTVLLSTHWVEDVPSLADRVIALDRGRVVYDGPSAGLVTTGTVTSRLLLRINGEKAAAAALIQERHLGQPIAMASDWLVVACAGSEKVAVVEALASAGISVVDLRVEEAPISDAILGLTAEEEGPR